MKNTQQEKAEDKFAREGAEIASRNPLIRDTGLVPIIQRTLRYTYFTQYEESGVSPDGIRLNAFVDQYKTGDALTRKAVKESIEYVRNTAPEIGRTYVHYYIQEALEKIADIDTMPITKKQAVA